MARQFKYTLDRRIVNRTIILMLKFGIAPGSYYLLTVTGRKTGRVYSVPVVLVEEGNARWLVAPYGEVDWVKNARASGRVNLVGRKWSGDFAMRELPPEESAGILKKYLEVYPITKPYFVARAGSDKEEFVQEARSKPVFELINIEAG